MKIVVLDGYTLNPGDLSWKSLESLGACDIYDFTTPEEIIPRAKDAEIVLTNKTLISKEVIDALPNLKYVGVLATGFNVVDLETAELRNIAVTNVPAYSTESVAQLTFAHILNLTHHAGHHDSTVKEGKWTGSRHFCYWDFPLVEIHDLILGIVGLGQIGQVVARIGQAFGMHVMAYDIIPPDPPPVNVELFSLEVLLEYADIVTLHCPLTVDNVKMINAASLSKMKNSAFLINTSRGGLIDEPALSDALNQGQIAGAGLDVLADEPPKADNPLIHAKNCYITPHIAWASFAARQRLMDIAVDNVAMFLHGEPQNVVNEVGD